MRWDDPRRNPYHDPDSRPPGWFLCLIAVGIAVAVTAIGWVVLYLREVFSARDRSGKSYQYVALPPLTS